MTRELSWRTAIDQVLASSPTPLHYNEVKERIVAGKLRKSLGATPAATVNALISTSIKRDGSDSPYIRVAKGTYALRPADGAVPMLADPLTPGVAGSTEAEEQYDIVTSFGMFWRRNAIEWVATPQVLGMQQIGATAVDFCKQLGVYLLYDGREVIYVGRATDRPLGKRLYEHTVDRMSARWDRFSWFGLLPVSGSGALGQLPDRFEGPKVIPALEAILIEALEPRQNRKRGDDLAAVEFIQRVDPEIEKKRVKATLDAALSKL